jgi:hypothetical protein
MLRPGLVDKNVNDKIVTHGPHPCGGSRPDISKSPPGFQCGRPIRCETSGAPLANCTARKHCRREEHSQKAGNAVLQRWYRLTGCRGPPGNYQKKGINDFVRSLYSG